MNNNSEDFFSLFENRVSGLQAFPCPGIPIIANSNLLDYFSPLHDNRHSFMVLLRRRWICKQQPFPDGVTTHDIPLIVKIVIMLTLNDIQSNIRSGDYSFSDHAVKRMIKRDILRCEVEDAIYNGEVIEEYPDDKDSPSCLIYGKTEDGRDLHVQVSLPPTVVIITAYEPDPKEWINCRVRR